MPEFSTAPPRPAHDGEAVAATPVFDPLRYCIFTTLALLGWLVGPVPMVAITSAVGLAAYFQARRQGLLRSRCVLGDTRLVMAYLGAALIASLVALAL